MSFADLLEARYGTGFVPEIGTAPDVNSTLETLLRHRSVRNYLPRPLAPGTLEMLVAAAQSASTSSNLQTWSVVALEDLEHKARAAVICGDQDFIRQAPLYLVFCADLNRLTRISEQAGSQGEGLQYLEMFLTASLDAALAAQNLSVAAEGFGLGTCYVGAARNRPRELSALLGLPRRTFALFGLTVGWPDPDHPASVKPRLPQAEVLHRETWNAAGQQGNFDDYDKTLADFDHSQDRAVVSWTNRSARRVADARSLSGRDLLHEILQAAGFELR